MVKKSLIVLLLPLALLAGCSHESPKDEAFHIAKERGQDLLDYNLVVAKKQLGPELSKNAHKLKNIDDGMNLKVVPRAHGKYCIQGTYNSHTRHILSTDSHPSKGKC